MRPADLAIAALEAGKHVVVEKPLDVSLKRSLRVAEAERRSGRTVAVISQHRFDASSQVVHQAVADGKFGRVTSGLASIAWWRSQGYYDSGDWRGTWELDGGALMNQGIHTVDLLIWRLDRPVEVFAFADCLAHTGIEVEDTAVATIRFADGALGVVHGTTAAYPGLTARLQIHGDRGSAVIDNDRLVYFHAAADGDASGSSHGAGGDGNQVGRVLPGPPADAQPSAAADPSARSDAHVLQYRDFLQAAAERRPPLVTVTDATRSLCHYRRLRIRPHRPARPGPHRQRRLKHHTRRPTDHHIGRRCRDQSRDGPARRAMSLPAAGSSPSRSPSGAHLPVSSQCGARAHVAAGTASQDSRCMG
ncbi:Gfo/Idh/MocA family protein [Streptomyces spiralis]|uniref:Gfo/Idh/MocA family protein n=1 Tax=Streptomyces spiralis TaxID=66376 RepID=UPI0033DDF267